VEVKVIDGLAAIFAGVDDDAVAFGKALVAGDLRGGLEKMAEEFAVLSAGVVERCEMFSGDDENVDGRLRMNVGEGVAELVLVDGGGWNGALSDFAE
jgi:hypothetical protein